MAVDHPQAMNKSNEVFENIQEPACQYRPLSWCSCSCQNLFCWNNLEFMLMQDINLGLVISSVKLPFVLGNTMPSDV